MWRLRAILARPTRVSALAPVAALLVSTGAALGLLTPLRANDAWALASASAAVALVVRPQIARWSMVGLALAAVGMARGASARDAVLESPLVRWQEQRVLDGRGADATPIRGVLTDDAEPGPFGARLRLAVAAVRVGDRWTGLAGRLQVSVAGESAKSEWPQWTKGRPVELVASLRWPQVDANIGGRSLGWQALTRPFDLVGSVKSAALVTVQPGTTSAELAASARRHVRRTVARHLGPGRETSEAVVSAILIGDRAALPDAVTHRLQAAGIYHVIAISGGNIAIVVGVSLAALGPVVRRARGALLASVCVVLAYASIVAPSPSVTRAVLTAVTYLGVSALGVRPPPGPVIGLVASLVILADPRTAVDVGAWLSFGATLGILLVAGRLAGRGPTLVGGSGGLRVLGLATGIFAATIAAEIALIPVQALVFGRVGVAGLAANFVAIPAMAVVQLTGFGVVAAAVVSEPLASLFASVAHLAATTLVGSARIVDIAPALVWRTPPVHVGWGFGYYAAAVILVGRTWPARSPAVRRVALVTWVGCGVVLIGSPVLPAGGPHDGLHVRLLDVGQGDAVLVRFPTGHTMLVDTGGGAPDVGERVLVPALWAAGVRTLDWLVITHADLDHIGGASEAAAVFRPSEIWEGVPVKGHVAREQLLGSTEARGAVWRTVTAGHTMRVGAVAIDVLSPPLPDWERPKVRNEDSVVLRLRYGQVEFLLTGDAGTEFEARPLAVDASARVRVLKVGHHGSRGSSSAPFLARYRPDVALISVGRQNLFSHPSPVVLDRLRGAGAVVFRTDREGALWVKTDGTRLSVLTQTGRAFDVWSWASPPRGSP